MLANMALTTPGASYINQPRGVLTRNQDKSLGVCRSRSRLCVTGSRAVDPYEILGFKPKFRVYMRCSQLGGTSHLKTKPHSDHEGCIS
eukprot:jgi/Botrbrau1/3841/Bobra.0183s0066.1